ncbi:MAG: hypothetical protein LBL77_00640 [Endomicrobium sp.]|jgi:hypothetical protein|nr:hypothetical protein [Endomicrobium sp.]
MVSQIVARVPCLVFTSVCKSIPKRGIDLWKTNRSKFSFNGEQFLMFSSIFFLSDMDNLPNGYSLLSYCYKKKEFNLLYRYIIEIAHKVINNYKFKDERVIQKLLRIFI